MAALWWAFRGTDRRVLPDPACRSELPVLTAIGERQLSGEALAAC
jgi:hypothetical protein